MNNHDKELLPLVSIIMPAYNAEKYIKKSIGSALAQTIENIELIVIDDCSKDDTVEVVSALAKEDARIRLYKNEQNMGVAGTRNLGLGLCTGKYVAFLDSDDIWYSPKLEIQLEQMRLQEADLSYTSYAIVDSDGNKQCADYLVPETISFQEMLKENVIGCSTVVARAEVIKKYKFEEAYFHEDYVLWLQLLQAGYKIVGVESVQVDYLFHLDSKAGNKFKSAQKRWKILHDYLKLSFIKSAWYFACYAFAGLRKYKKGLRD